MVKVILRGGLGNQMFQYAAGLNLALQQKTRLVLDTTYLNDRLPRAGFTYRNYDLDVFDIKPNFSAFSKISSRIPVSGFWIRLDLFLMKFQQKLGVRKSHVLWGYYQSEKYFAEYKDAVRAAFRFRDALAGEAAAIGEKIAHENSVAIHVRRGDYLTAKAQAVHGLMGADYYDRAVAHIKERVADPHFYVFSDDIAWCRENIKPPFPTSYLDDTSRGPKASFHLQLMSLCKHNIIANSSFSWWGAWLNANPGKIVIAPEKWQVDGSAQDVVPGDWIKISNS